MSAETSTELTKRLMARTTTINQSMERLRDLMRFHEAVTLGEQKLGRDGREAPVTEVEVQFSYRKVKLLIADAFPDLPERLHAMIEAEDIRLHDARVDFVTEVNDTWGQIERLVHPVAEEARPVRPINLEEHS